MLLVWIVAGLIHCGHAGDLYSTVEAHGPLARQALDIYRTSGALHPSLPTVLAATAREAPVAATPVHHVTSIYPVAPAPVDVVHHVPSVVDVPVTKYVSQPGYIQKLVNVPKTDIATAKLEVRRPAIQKKFYDIEHRTVVRPVGSAVVELDQPVAQKYITPFIDSSGGRHPVAQFQRPVAYPLFSYPFYSPQYIPGQNPYYFTGQVPQYVPGQAFPPSFLQIPQRPLLPPQQTPVSPQTPQRPSVPVGPLPQAPQPSIPSPDDIETNIEFDPIDTVAVDNPDFTKSQNTTDSTDDEKESEDTFEDFAKEVYGETSKDVDANEKEDSDAIQHILDEFEKRQNLRKLLRQNDFQPNDLDKLHHFAHQSVNNQKHEPQPTLKAQTSSETSQADPLFDNFHVLEHSEPNFMIKVETNADETATNTPIDNQQSYNGGLLEHAEPQFTFKIVPVSDNFEQEAVDEEKHIQEDPNLEEIRKILEHSEREFSLKIGVNRENTLTSTSTSQPITQEKSSSTTPKLETSSSPQRSSFGSENNNDLLKVSPNTEHKVPSFRKLSSEELQENQQKLIKLLTGQGLISEIALSRSGIQFDPVGDLGLVRGKVVSVTAAPKSLQAEERVSTRRVVVSRPVHTVEEVDVHHPVTRLQSMTVHEPTLVQTAHAHIARVPATLPVLSRTLAYH